MAGAGAAALARRAPARPLRSPAPRALGRVQGLGNGGLGRLASCFLDSIATLNMPGWGYGLRYKYGLFKQSIAKDGEQLEAADDWLVGGNPWEKRRADVAYTVRFGGSLQGPAGVEGPKAWTGGQTIKAVAHDTPIPGYNTTNTIRRAGGGRLRRGARAATPLLPAPTRSR